MVISLTLKIEIMKTQKIVAVCLFAGASIIISKTSSAQIRLGAATSAHLSSAASAPSVNNVLRTSAAATATTAGHVNTTAHQAEAKTVTTSKKAENTTASTSQKAVNTTVSAAQKADATTVSTGQKAEVTTVSASEQAKVNASADRRQIEGKTTAAVDKVKDTRINASLHSSTSAQANGSADASKGSTDASKSSSSDAGSSANVAIKSSTSADVQKQ
jgi:hypothetical protein